MIIYQIIVDYLVFLRYFMTIGKNMVTGSRYLEMKMHGWYGEGNDEGEWGEDFYQLSVNQFFEMRKKNVYLYLYK